jgi:hypothetical protein
MVRSVSSVHAASKSATEPSVAATAPASPPAPAPAVSTPTLVQAAGTNALLPSGNTNSSSRRPCRRIRPSSGSDCPTRG